MKFTNIFMNILSLSFLAVSVACSETEEQCPKIRTIEAVIARAETRTALDGPDADGIYKTVWSSGDEIMVFSGDSELQKFTLTSGENTNKGVFEGSADSDDLAAIYPFSIGLGGTGETAIVRLSEIQEYVSGGIPEGAYPMAGTYSNGTFSFKNLCSVLKIPLFGEVTVKSITFTPNSSNVKASGKATVSVCSTKLEMAADAASSVMLDCPDVKLSTEPTDFHFVVPAQTYPGGFTLTIATDQGDVTKTLGSDITLVRSVLYPVEAFECKVDDGSDEEPVFSVDPTYFDINGDQQDITVTVTANMEYSISSIPEWISPKSADSGIHTLTVSANTTSSARSGKIIFKNVNDSLLTVTVSQEIQTYTSSDYSQDGFVTRLQSSTVGKGIDVVFVGDAFADKDQELFNKYVNLGMEAFFTEEPFKSTKDRFNIYRIGSVSKNGIITQEGGDTKFSAEFGQGTNISGNNKAVFGFVQENMPSVDLTKTIIFVIINKAQYAGTCWMYSNNQAICYVPLCRDENDYAQTLRHEGCGHGFGKLADEYSYTSQGTIPEDKGNDLKQWRSFAYGFYENVDLTSDPATILWSRFISDSRYSGKVGVYEGGYTYPYGVYRPTENSIMRHNTGGFNAPSREAIYKKIMRFSEGGTWTYDYEAFVEFDSPARSAEAITRAAAQCAAIDESSFIPLAPPVMVMADE